MKKAARKQPTPQELRDQLLDFLRRKFYAGHAVNFAKDQRRLLAWVVLWPATWLDERAVTISADQYHELFCSVFQDALTFGDVGNIRYLPAYLASVIQKHFDHHGDEIYAAAKNVRTLTENALAVAGKLPQAAPDPVRGMAEAAALLKPTKRHAKPAPKAQLNLF